MFTKLDNEKVKYINPKLQQFRFLRDFSFQNNEFFEPKTRTCNLVEKNETIKDPNGTQLVKKEKINRVMQGFMNGFQFGDANVINGVLVQQEKQTMSYQKNNKNEQEFRISQKEKIEKYQNT